MEVRRCRDSDGAFGEAKAIWYDRVLDACMMEVLACRDGVRMALDAGRQRLHLGTDCLELVQLWKKKDYHRSMVGPVLEDIKDLSRA